jgi:superfamily I DNA and/or RNA helicase
MSEIKEFLKFAKSNPKNQDGEPWSIAVLTFHQAQATILREGLRKLTRQPNKMSRFNIKDIEILLYTVDKFQGMEADIVFISMMKTQSIGFLDNINRLNVALTRAKYQRVIIGDKRFFENQRGSEELKRLARQGGM